MKPLVYRKSRRTRAKQAPRPQKLAIAKGDRVRVIRGDDRGTEGTVIRVLPKRGRVVVDGVNVVSKHRRATATDQESAIVKFPAPIHVSNVMLLDPKSGTPTRIRRHKDKDGVVERLSKRSGQPIPRNR
jgi:large subunit ribosomal protein L24